MTDFECLKEKRLEVLKAIKPICDAFEISNYDYEITEEGLREFLRLNDTRIGCACNSVGAVIDELIGYIFIKRWCRNRYLGAFEAQTKNVIKSHWLKDATKHQRSSSRPVSEPPHAEESEVVKTMWVAVRRKFEEGER